MLEFNNQIVVILRMQAKHDKEGNPRAAYIVNTYEGETVKIFKDTPEGNRQMKECFPNFVKPTFIVNVEVSELIRVVNHARYL